MADAGILRSPATPGSLPQRGRSPWREAARRFGRNPTGVFGAILLALLILGAIGSPVLAPFDPLEQAPLDALQAPSGKHFFGTDQFGRDLFSRLLYGGRASLPVGLI
jgi:peptide/nickel transport system permease protein